MNLPMYSSLLSSVACIGADAGCLASIAEAIRRFNPDLPVQPFRTLDEAADAPARTNEVLVLCEPDAATVAKALATLDAAALPRWAVAILGETPEGGSLEVPAVPRAEWTPSAIAQLFRAALATHRLRRENARLRGDLATLGSRIAHDLRTPLGGVVATAEVLREILLDSNPANAALTQPVLDSAEGLVKLIERMSFFTKVLASREPAQRVDMGTSFWNAYQLLESRILGAGATLAHPRDWPAVEGHPAWLQTVWWNLIANALQHGGPAVRIEAGWTREQNGTRFWLRDSGGVPPEKRAALFFPFHRLHEPSAARGLGLAIVHRLVELEGGSCGFETPADGGSCFFFTLPSSVQPVGSSSKRPG